MRIRTEQRDQVTVVIVEEEEPLQFRARGLLGERPVRLGLLISQRLHRHDRTLASIDACPAAFPRSPAASPDYVLADQDQSRRDFLCANYSHPGLVLVEPEHEDCDSYMPKELNELYQGWDPDQAVPDELPDEIIQFYRGLFTREMADWPEEICKPLIERHVSPEWLKIGGQEAANRYELHDEVRNAGPMPDVPLIVLTATAIDPFKEAVTQGIPTSLLHEAAEAKTRLYTVLAKSVAHGENRVIDDAGHLSVIFRRPDAVLQAIQDLLGS